jgi:hypothetical protein
MNPPGWVLCRRCTRCFFGDYGDDNCMHDGYCHKFCGMKLIVIFSLCWAVLTSVVCAAQGGSCGGATTYLVIWGLAFGFICLRTCMCVDVMFFILFKIPKFLLGRAVEFCFRDREYTTFD